MKIAVLGGGNGSFAASGDLALAGHEVQQPLGFKDLLRRGPILEQQPGDALQAQFVIDQG